VFAHRNFCVVFRRSALFRAIPLNISAIDEPASSWQFDDAMIRLRSGRMTVAQLKQRMDGRFKVVDKRFRAVDRRFDTVDKRFDAIDKRFDKVDKRFEAVDKRFEAVDKRFEVVDKRFEKLTARMDAGFLSLHEKLNVVLRVLDDKYEHHRKILNNHEERLNDLEGGRPAH
jgi:chromosome segregation ATPase